MSDPTPPPGDATPEGSAAEPMTPAQPVAEPMAPAQPVADPMAPEPPAAPASWPAAPPATPMPPPGGGYPAAYAPAGAYPPAPVPVSSPTSSNAVIAFVLSIVSWAICPIIPAIVALVLASSAQKEIDAGGGRVQGAGLVTAARIISWINIGLWAAVIVIGIFFAVLVAVAGAV